MVIIIAPTALIENQFAHLFVMKVMKRSQKTIKDLCAMTFRDGSDQLNLLYAFQVRFRL